MFIFFIGLSCCIYGQVMKGTLHKKGIIVHNSSFSKHFVVLMQDTMLSGNRFDNWFGLSVEGSRTVNPKTTIQLPAFIIDSALLVKSEERLLQNDSSVTFYNYLKCMLTKKLKKYIHLYAGYLDTACQLNVVVQFVTLKEYKKDKNIYSQELWLMAQQKTLRFAVIKYKKGEY